MSERTKATASLRGVFVLAAAIFAGGIGVGMRQQTLVLQVASLQNQFGDLVTKRDLRDMQRDFNDSMRWSLGSLLVKCPRHVLRGESFVTCQVVIGEKESKK